jgi:hypothetical protein
VGLDIDMIRTKQQFGPFDREVLGDIDVFAAAIVAFAG